jgi:hypothetical protein
LLSEVAMRRTLTALSLLAAACAPNGLFDGGDAGGDGGIGGEDLSGPSQDLSGPSHDLSGPSQDLSGPSQDLSKPLPDLSPPIVALTGHVTIVSPGSNNAPLAGATVQVLGASPANQTTSASDGSYTLMVTPGATLFVGGSASTYVNVSFGVVVPLTGGTVNLGLIPQTLFDSVTGSLSPPLSADPTKGHVAVIFNNINNAGGYGATISASHDPTFTIANGAAMGIYSSTTIQGDVSGLIFPNTVAGWTTVALSAPAGKSCTLHEPITNWRVDPGYALNVIADCM